ncbi:Uroporphyrinogen-III C-methyltransferase [Botrimarina colliarenosi]|uniref:uroporphyrinogen-III C-methyltransferase n=1 Tax=Botrimarina colliarenosi TaxID=2528001 RepID=A0A5C6AKB3_9BACT|nr:uroporphyrinogen-III C-methyltransferase [Botrimarina colliarenosi]TWT99688.1 Uroporphyrinogen-III C-methyltransferase [Botrimarina colliarenosi]
MPTTPPGRDPAPSARSSSAAGRVYLVGAGPGDPELLTLAGARRLAEADVVLYDYLANDALLRHAAPHAERVGLGRHGVGKLWTQDEINQRMVAEAQAGRTVVRLKGGDPSVFGRVAEEITALQAAGVEYAIVPGVTTAVAAGAYAGVTITDRDHASCVALVTGHDRRDGDPSGTADFAKLAAFPGTLVVYMGVTNAPEWSRRLIEAGKPADTPVTIVRRCSLPDQQTLHGVLGDLPTILAPKRMRPPLVVVIGAVAGATEDTNWFTSRPLFGKTVLVTRPAGQGGAMAQRLADLGARVLEHPVIAITPPDDPAALDDAIDHLADYSWIAFSSRNGVDVLLTRMQERGRDARSFGGAKIAAIGPATSEALAAWRLHADVVPDEYRAEALAESLREEVTGRRVLLIRASRGRETLAETLREAGAEVDQVVAYQSRDVTTPDEAILEEITAGRVDWITVTSSAIARATTALFGKAIRESPTSPRFAAISPLTAATLQDVGYEADAVASEYTADGVIDAILKHAGWES